MICIPVLRLRIKFSLKWQMNPQTVIYSNCLPTELASLTQRLSSKIDLHTRRDSKSQKLFVTS